MVTPRMFNVGRLSTARRVLCTQLFLRPAGEQQRSEEQQGKSGVCLHGASLII